MGALVGGGVGALTGAVLSLAQRIAPWLGRVLGILGFVTTVASIMLDSTQGGPDPQTYLPEEQDPDGNSWAYRNIERRGRWGTRGRFFPVDEPHGLGIRCTDGTILAFGEEEEPLESAYGHSLQTMTPITEFVRDCARVNWHSMRTAEGSWMWYWQDLATRKEYIMNFRDDETMREALRRHREEQRHSFIQTSN